MDITGTLQRVNGASNSADRSLWIESGGTVTVNSGGIIDVDNGAAWDMIYVVGTLTSAGTLTSQDLWVDGGYATILNGGVVNANDNLQVFNDGTNYSDLTGTTVNGVSVSSVTYSAAGNSVWDFGDLNYRYLRMLLRGPTYGGLSVIATIHANRTKN